ncbi:hypothetical protein CHEID_02395 [Corynebacterium heidelbergense]|nr:hypothetical protein CHEID_02395 [Corynebacterium heidelbergense]
MSRDYRDQRGGHRWIYPCKRKTATWFMRDCRRTGRRKAKQDLKHGREPQPIYPVERRWLE